MKTRKTIYLIFTIVCCAVISITVKAQTINLLLQSDYTNEGTAYSPSLAVGDVNNDGRPDLVATNRPAAGGDFIAVYLNNGAGGFNAALPAGNNFSARVVALGDFNEDGNLDMAVGSDGLFNALNIRLGNGTGNFPTGTSSGTSTDIESISEMVAADFNGDGNLDLLVTDVSGYNSVPFNAVKLLLGDGAGNFPISTLTAYAVQFGGANDIEVSDFNVDGRPDVAVTAPNSNIIQVLINNGAGGFNAALNTTYNGARKFASADFNRDCIPDIAVSNGSSGISIFLGTGTGGFGAPNPIAITNQTDAVAVGDFNRDKKVDVAVRRISSTAGVPNFTILPGNGAGGFGTAFELMLPIATSSANSLAVLDANKDGRADIIINRNGGFLLYHGNSARFTQTENDFDGDLRTDLSVYRPSAGDWYIHQTTQGAFQQHWGIPTDKPVAADYDNDGKADLAVWRENGFGDPDRSYFWIQRSSDNTLQQEQFGREGDTPMVVGDWDDDGRADVAVYRNAAAAGEPSIFFYRPSGDPAIDFRVILWGTRADQPIRGDFDGDGAQDAAIFRASDSLWYILQSSNGQAVYASWGLATDRRVAADYDGDGLTDLAVYRDGVWSIRRSSNGSSAYYRWGSTGDALVPSDYNGDGLTDVAVYRPSEQRWYTPQCADFKMYGTKFGTAGDVAVPSTLVP